MVLGMVVFFATSAVLVTTMIPPPTPVVAQAAAPAVVNGPSWEFFNPELDQLIEELRKERENLATRERQLQELAARLQVEREELDGASRSIRKLQSEFDRDMTRLKEDEAVNLKKLAKMYAIMEPEGAANIMKELDDAVLVKIMLLMKEEQNALILDALARIGPEETKRAARISEILRLAVPVRSATPKS